MPQKSPYQESRPAQAVRQLALHDQKASKTSSQIITRKEVGWKGLWLRNIAYARYAQLESVRPGFDPLNFRFLDIWQWRVNEIIWLVDCSQRTVMAEHLFHVPVRPNSVAYTARKSDGQGDQVQRRTGQADKWKPVTRHRYHSRTPQQSPRAPPY